jgi:hypothetical protein
MELSIEYLERIKRDGKWIGVDLDGTLAKDVSGDIFDETAIGDPIELMLERVKEWLEMGVEVRILTARAGETRNIQYVEKWCQTHLGKILMVTDKKDYDMARLFDDRAVQVDRNMGTLSTTEAYNRGYSDGIGDAHHYSNKQTAP